MAKQIPLDEARGSLNQIIDELRAGGEPVALTEAGGPTIVILIYEDYDLLVGAVQQVAVKEDGRARIELEVDEAKSLDRGVDAIGVGRRLAVDALVIDQTDPVRSGQYLQAAVGSSRRVHRDHAASHERE